MEPGTAVLPRYVAFAKVTRDADAKSSKRESLSSGRRGRLEAFRLRVVTSDGTLQSSSRNPPFVRESRESAGESAT